MDYERSLDFELDEFFRTGKEIAQLERMEQEIEQGEDLDESSLSGREEDLLQGKIKRENLKNDLFDFLSSE